MKTEQKKSLWRISGKGIEKGFSLVELIIVIAIMAILAAAIAPALIRYIDKARRADDVQAAGTIQSAANAAMADSDVYEGVMNGIDKADNKHRTVIAFSDLSNKHLHFTPYKDSTAGAINHKVDYQSFCDSLLQNLGGEVPKPKYRKAIKIKGKEVSMGVWYIAVGTNGSVEVGLAVDRWNPGTGVQLVPDCSPEYK